MSQAEYEYHKEMLESLTKEEMVELVYGAAKEMAMESSSATKIAMIVSGIVFAQTSIQNFTYLLSYSRGILVDYGLWPVGILSG